MKNVALTHHALWSAFTLRKMVNVNAFKKNKNELHFQISVQMTNEAPEKYEKGGKAWEELQLGWTVKAWPIQRDNLQRSVMSWWKR